MGDMTIADFLEIRKLLPTYRSSADVMICTLDEESLPFANETATNLREQGINVAVNYTYKSPGDQIKSAVKQSIPYAIIIGEKETASKTYEIKDLINETIVTEIKKAK